MEDFLAASCLKRSLDPVEHFVRVKKRRERAGADRDAHNSSQKYFVPHRADLIETYVSAMYIPLEGCSQVVLALDASGQAVSGSVWFLLNTTICNISSAQAIWKPPFTGLTHSLVHEVH